MNLEILVENRFRDIFDKIIKKRKLEIIKEERTSTELGYWVTVQVESCNEAYLLGLSFGLVRNCY
jgi:hypothetical protein